MASSTETPKRDTLQAEIAFQTSEVGGRMTTFVIKDKVGNCTVPPYTNVRLLNCTIQSLKVTNSSIIYIGGGKIEGNAEFSVANSALIIENVQTWSASILFTNSKIEISGGCKIGQTITLKNSSYLKSIGNLWETTAGNIGIVAQTGSRVESLRDTWGKWKDYFWKATTNSIIKIIDATKIDDVKGGLALVDDSSIVVLSHPKLITITGTKPVFDCTKNSKVEVYNFDSLKADNIIFKLNNSRAVVRNISTLKSTQNQLGDLTNSSIDFSNVSNLSADKNSGFKLVNSNLNFSNTSSIKTQDTVFSLNQSNINFVSKSFDYNSENDSGTAIESLNDIAIQATDSKIFVKNLSSIKSGAKQAIDLTKSSFKGTNITNIIGGSSGGLITCNQAYLTLTNIKTMSGKATEGVYLQSSKGSFLNINAITSQNGTAIKAIDSSSVVVRNVKEISAVANGVVLDSNSTLILKGNNTKISGRDGKGVSVGAGCRVVISTVDSISSSQGNGIGTTGATGRIILKDINSITGGDIGLNIVDAELVLDNSGAINPTVSGQTGIKLNSSAPLGTYKATIIGPVTVQGNTALDGFNYQIDEQGITWNGNVVTTNCISKNTLSKTSGSTTEVGSHSDHIMTSLDQDLRLSGVSSMRLRGSSLAGTAMLDKSLLDIGASTANDITLANSFLGAFFSKIGSVSLSGLSSALGGASQGVNLNFSSGDAAYSDPTAYFITSSGDMAFQADNDILMEALDFKVTVREDIVFDSPSQVLYTGDAELVLTVGGSSITITPSSIAGVASSISWN